MIHLIDRIYLCLDTLIDTHKDRIVVSKEHGYQMHEVIEKISAGILFKYGTTVEEVFEDKFEQIIADAIEISRTRGRSFYIFADKKSLIKIQIMWFKLILKNPDAFACFNIHQSNAMRFNIYQKAFYATNTKLNYSTTREKFLSEFEKIQTPKITHKKSFSSKHSELLGVEYLLATYLHSGRLKSELKNSVQKLVRKNLDDILLEYKGIFLGFYTNDVFAENIKLEKRYGLNDLDIFSDNSRIAEFFLSGRLFRTQELKKPSANGNFRFDLMTEEDHETFRMFTAALGSHYTHNNSLVTFNDGLSPLFRDSYKWQFLPIAAGDYDDDLLEKLLEVEMTLDYAQGIFFNKNLETVNGHLVQHILRLHKKGDTEELAKYTLAT